MTEAEMTTRFSHWVKANRKRLPCMSFEAKLCDLTKKKSVGLCDFEPHQLPNLRCVASPEGLYWKMPDLGCMNPFDGFHMKGEGWVVLFWYVPRKLSRCTVIGIREFDAFIAAAGKKSIRHEEAEKIAVHAIDL